MRILITGANGHLGLKLARRLNETRPDDRIVALVRSETAAARIRREGLDAEINLVDYRDAAGIGRAADGCDAIVHLVGIIRQSRANSFEAAHEDTCRALVAAGSPAMKVVYLSILGSDPDAPNACLRSRARAERILLDGPMAATVIRVPMVLGRGDYASAALARHARARLVFTFRSGSLEQPIFSDDVIRAVLSALLAPGAEGIVELAGPQSLSRADLIRRAGAIFDNRPAIISLPIRLGYLLAWLLETCSDNPPVTRAMLGVLDHDDNIDTTEAQGRLGISLTDLEQMLRAVL